MAPRGLQNLQHLIHFCVRFFNIPKVKRSLYSLNCSEKKKYNNQYPYTRFSFMRESRNISRVRGGGGGREQVPRDDFVCHVLGMFESF